MGAVAVLLALAGVAATLYATGVFGGSEKNGAKIEEQSGDEKTAVTDLSSPSEEGESPQYRYRAEACEQVDWKAMEKMTGLDSGDVENTYEPYPDNVLVKCSTPETGTKSSYTVEIRIKDKVSAAEEEYESLTAGSDDKSADGPWSRGVWAVDEVTDGAAGVYLHAQDSNLYLTFSASTEGDDDVDKLKELVVAATEDLFAALVLEGE